MTSAVLQTLLVDYRPFVVYDTRETFRADSPAVLTDLAVSNNQGSYCNILRRKNGEIIAVADPSLYGDTYPALNLQFLSNAGGEIYPSGLLVESGDRVDAHPRTTAADAARMHENPDLANMVYGRGATDKNRTFLQYWFFYYFNDLFADRHEGDWEMIQINLGDSNKPESATYSQHKHGDTWDWEDIPKHESAPIVYPALGSHANYFEGGRHHSGLLDGFDNHDGGNGDLIRPTLVSLDTGTPGWLSWPGKWGATDGWVARSPSGLAHQSGKWNHPDAFRRDGEKPLHPWLMPESFDIVPPPLPTTTVLRHETILVITSEYGEISTEVGARPVQLLVTIDRGNGVPLTYRVSLDPKSGRGTLCIPAARIPDATAVRITARTQSGAESPTSEPIPIPPKD